MDYITNKKAEIFDVLAKMESLNFELQKLNEARLKLIGELKELEQSASAYQNKE
jgi:predicted nuclease with TOPRIM domain